MIITRTEIMECLDSYVKDYIVDAPWHISLVKDFMSLLDGDNFDSDNLTNWNYIKTIIKEKEDSEYAKKVLMRKTPEMYISGLFDVIVNRVKREEIKDDKAAGNPQIHQKCLDYVNHNMLNDELLVTPLCIVEDRYGGCYSGARYLALNMSPFSVGELDIDAGDLSCEEFWEQEAEDYIIGKGITPLEALIDLKEKLKSEGK